MLRPLEETLILSGWKDNKCFYGGNDVYMTVPRTARQRNALKQHERTGRGFAFSIASILEEEVENEDSSMRASDEDMLLPHIAPDCIVRLPSYLWSLRTFASPATALEIVLSRRSREVKAEKHKAILRDFIFVYRDDIRMLFRSIVRSCDPVLGGIENAEPQLFLDYLPILRTIAVQERISEAIHNAAPSDGATKTNRHRRSTRQTSKRGYVHYLESLAPPQTWRISDQSAKIVGDVLATNSLLYECT